MAKRRSYSREFKVEAVKLVTDKGMSVAEAARSLGLHENLLRSWKVALDKESKGDQPAFPGHGNRPALEQEIHRLAEAGPVEQEVADAKSYLEGSYALGLDTSSKVVESSNVFLVEDDLAYLYVARRATASASWQRAHRA